MMDVIVRPDFATHWSRAAKRGAVDWDEIFADYRSAVDWPVCDYYRELADWYPDAKVILTVRNAELWFASTQNTIFSSINNFFEQQSPIGEIVRELQIVTLAERSTTASCWLRAMSGIMPR